MQTFPLPLCQGIRGFSVTKEKALSKAGVFALMKRSAASLSEEEALTIRDLPNTNTAARLWQHDNERRETCENHPPARASSSIAEEPHF